MKTIFLLTLLLLTNTCFSADYQFRYAIASMTFPTKSPEATPPKSLEQRKAEQFCNGYILSDLSNYDSGEALPSYKTAMSDCTAYNLDNSNISTTCQNLADALATANGTTKEDFIAACETGNISSINQSYAHSKEEFCSSKAEYYLELNPENQNKYSNEYIKNHCMTN